MGPLQVVSHQGHEYVLRNLVTGKTLNRHVTNLKAFIPSRVSPLDVARRDSEVYLVEKIISHTGDPRRKADMKFRVRWLGFGPDDDTLEGWSSLRNNWVFHRYLREQGLRQLIPAEFRDESAYIGVDGVSSI
jgi:hypothetical protein